ncbi:MAG TPA: LodA/GoxA family CTQ-dependent oxidase [Propionibacteriaceae bacterium]|nr:LodA/GoxA family CTQ-dependent oxidase [Propionibacteriaceae bacterium]
MDEIARYVIYPGIGIARVGNSPEEYFIGPEAPGELPTPEGGFKDSVGRIKRQAARFRVYGLDHAGQAVREITADGAKITWRVHLANRKAAGYQFLNAMDLGPKYAKTAGLRNGTITGDDRGQLVIDPGPRSISGRDTQGAEYAFNSGEFMGQQVPLGELRTDSAGRLLVLGGFGASASYTGKPATTFANNDGWHDDISDGPVRATVVVDGKEFEAEPAAVAVTPPNYGQGLYGAVTMYDVVYDLFCRDSAFSTEVPPRPSFWRHIFPIFERLVGTSWVNGGANFLFGAGSPSDLTAPGLLQQLASRDEAFKHLRTSYFNWFRDPADGAGLQEPEKLPPFYGDTFGDYPHLAMDDLAVTVTQYHWLRQWAEGDFDDDPADRDRPATLADYPLPQQPGALDEANLESCLGGPFHPGIELTWTLRVGSMWRAPFRLNILDEGAEPRMDYGPSLTPAEALGPDGVVESTGPGTLTWWMGVPWQTDEASCLSGYEVGTYLPLPSFWAARVPNQVLSERSYSRLMNDGLPVAQRLKHLFHRPEWLRYFGPDYNTRINDNVAQWDKLGIVAPHDGPSDHAEHGLPERLWVETELAEEFTKSDPTWEQVRIAERIVRVPVEEAAEVPMLAAARLATERDEVPLRARRRVLRRDEL